MSHTLGPWYVLGTAHPELTIFADEWKKAHRATVISVLPKAYLRITVDRAEDSGDPLPDARLVAAAPDLLAALRRLHNPEKLRGSLRQFLSAMSGCNRHRQGGREDAVSTRPILQKRMDTFEDAFESLRHTALRIKDHRDDLRRSARKRAS